MIYIINSVRGEERWRVANNVVSRLLTTDMNMIEIFTSKQLTVYAKNPDNPICSMFMLGKHWKNIPYYMKVRHAENIKKEISNLYSLMTVNGAIEDSRVYSMYDEDDMRVLKHHAKSGLLIEKDDIFFPKHMEMAISIIYIG